MTTTGADEGRGVPVTAVDDSTRRGRRGHRRGRAAAARADDPRVDGPALPGPADLDAFTVAASWGIYQRRVKDRARTTRRGRAATSARRSRSPSTVAVADLAPGITTAYPLKDDVVLRVDRYDDPSRPPAHRGRPVQRPGDPRARSPSTRGSTRRSSHVDAGGETVFLPVTDALVDTRYERDDELRRLQLQYRDRLEFAVGRTCSVDWDAAPGARRATEVWTTWLPTCETPQTTRRGDRRRAAGHDRARRGRAATS